MLKKVLERDLLSWTSPQELGDRTEGRAVEEGGLLLYT